MLSDLELSGNRLSSTIPTQLGNLHRLLHLYLPGNMLTGVIPSEIRNLNFGGTELTGPVPDYIGDFTKLEYLWIYSTKLTGTVPSLFGQLALSVERDDGKFLFTYHSLSIDRLALSFFLSTFSISETDEQQLVHRSHSHDAWRTVRPKVSNCELHSTCSYQAKFAFGNQISQAPFQAYSLFASYRVMFSCKRLRRSRRIRLRVPFLRA